MWTSRADFFDADYLSRSCERAIDDPMIVVEARPPIVNSGGYRYHSLSLSLRTARAYAINNKVEDRVLVHGSRFIVFLHACEEEKRLKKRGYVDEERGRGPGKAIVNSVDNGPLFDTNTNDPRYGTIIDKPIQRRRKIGEIEQNGCFAVGL